MKRISIRKRIFTYNILIALVSLAAIITTSVICMITIRNEEAKTLVWELDRNYSSIVKNKADVTEARLEHYEGYIRFLADYIHNMYSKKDELIKTGTMVYPPSSSTPKDVYEITRLLTTPEHSAEELKDEILFYSNLKDVLDPIAKENDGVISTIYLGTRFGLMISYDKYSYLSVQENDAEQYYDYTKSAWYPKALETDGIFYTDLYTDSEGRGLTVTVGSPVYDDAGEFQGAICADIGITTLYDEMISMDLGEGSYSFALDSDRHVISPDAADVSKEEYTGLEEADLDILTAGGSGILERNDSFYIYTPVERIGWTLCSRVPKSLIMENISEVDRSLSIAWVVFVLVAAVAMLGAIVASRKSAASITKPIEKLGEDMETIAKGELDHKSVPVRNDEVGDMSNRLNEMVETLKATMEDLSFSKQHAEKMSELANKDALTGVRNRTSYDNHMRILQRELEEGNTRFGLMMADLNDLKHINDTYGHDKGNTAIRKLGAMLCDVFVHSPVFRIGGDEFILILKGRDYDSCAELAAEFYRRLDELGKNDSLAEWEKISAAIGYALYDEKLDRTAEDVSIRADKAMYDRKKEMKAE